MSRYRVNIQDNNFYTYEVKANDAKEARELASRLHLTDKPHNCNISYGIAIMDDESSESEFLRD